MTLHSLETRPLMEARQVVKHFTMRRGAPWPNRPVNAVAAVDGVSLELAPGEALGIVGESGSGKSTLARCLVGLQQPTSGSVIFDGVDIASAKRQELRALRGRVQMIFQDPYMSLNPRLSAGAAIVEAGEVHGRVGAGANAAFVDELLRLVGLSPQMAARRPYALSGGQRQRVAIARALAVGPELLVADEAVSALDVSVQAQILRLFADLRAQLNLSLIFISHQLAVVSLICETVAIMYLGRVVEYGPIASVFRHPQHPYTKALLDAHPEPDPGYRRRDAAIRGDMPSPFDIPSGCRFRTRCPYAVASCSEADPELVDASDSGPSRGMRAHLVACPIRPFGTAPSGNSAREASQNPRPGIA